MLRSSLRVAIATVLLAAVLAPPCALAAPGASRPALAPSGLLDLAPAWQPLARFWGWLGTLWSKEGCSIDPLGVHCVRTPAAGSGAASPRPEPQLVLRAGTTSAATAGTRFGVAHNAAPWPPVRPAGDNGCSIDPLGQCMH